MHGLSVVELLVATAIGALLLAMASVMLVSANAAWTSQADGAAIDDSGRFAMELVSRATRQAAFVDWEGGDAAAAPAAAPDSATAPPSVTGRDALTLPRTSAGIDGATAEAVNGSDILALRYAGVRGGAVDCAGFAVDAGEEGWSIFHVARNGAGEAELRCKYRGAGGWGSDAIVDGVDTFQVLYGVDTDDPADGIPNEFVSASTIEARDAALVLAGADEGARQRDLQRRTWWKRVAAVRVALVLHGMSIARRAAAVYDAFGPAYSASIGASDDGVHLDEAAMTAKLGARERRLFTATIALRNAAPGEP